MIQQTHFPNIDISLMQYHIMIHTYRYCIDILPYQYVSQIPTTCTYGTYMQYNVRKYVICSYEWYTGMY